MANNKYIINVNSFEELTEPQKMILSIKGALEEIKANPDQEQFFGMFIGSVLQDLKEKYNISKDEIFKYRFNINS